MKRTRAGTLVALGLAGGVIGFLLDLAIATMGRPIIVPPVTLPITLVVIGGIVLGFAIPIHRATTGRSTARIDPFRALRVAVLAKASSLSGSLIAGLAAGVLVYLLSRAVVPSLGSVWLAIATVAGAVILLVAGLVAEHLCTIPPGGDDDDTTIGEPSHIV